MESGGHLIVVDSNIPAGRGKSPLLEFLEKRWYNDKKKKVDIDVLCISHPDLDHYHGMLEALEFVLSGDKGRIRHVVFHGLLPAFKEALEPYQANLTGISNKATEGAVGVKGMKEYNRLCELLKDLPFTEPGGCQSIPIAKELKLDLLGPVWNTIRKYQKQAVRTLLVSWSGENPEAVSPNPVSAVLRLEVEGIVVLLTGDMDSKSWRAAVASHRPTKPELYGPAHIVKAPHHGSGTDQDPNFWSEFLRTDGHAVISAGHRHRHPAEKTVRAIKRVVGPTRFFCTNVCSEYKKLQTPLSIHFRNETGSHSPCHPYHEAVTFKILKGGVRCTTGEPPTPACRHHCEE